MRSLILILFLTCTGVWCDINNNIEDQNQENDIKSDFDSLFEQLGEQVQLELCKSFEQQITVLKNEKAYCCNQLDNLTGISNDKQQEITNIAEKKQLDVYKEETLNLKIGDTKSMQKFLETFIESYEEKLKLESNYLSSEDNVEKELVLDLLKQFYVVLSKLAEQKENSSDQETFYKNELIRLTGIINEQEKELKKINEKNKELENILKDPVTSDNIVEKNDESIKNESQNVTEDLEKEVNQLKDWTLSEKDPKLQLDQEPQQSSNSSLLDIEVQLATDDNNLKIIANNYHIPIEKIKEWIRKEAEEDLKNQVTFVSLEDKLKKQSNEEIEENTEELKLNSSQLENFVKQYQTTIAPKVPLNTWQLNEQEYLLSLIHTKKISKKTNFEEFLTNDRIRMEKVASDFSTKLDDIIEFSRKEYEHLKKINLISDDKDTYTIDEWKKRERLYVKYLLDEKALSIEELEEKLENGNKRLYVIAKRFNLTIEEIQEWYTIELQKLIKKKQIYLERLENWKNRLAMIVVHQKYNIEEVKNELENDRELLEKYSSQNGYNLGRRSISLDNKSDEIAAKTLTANCIDGKVSKNFEDSVVNLLKPNLEHVNFEEFTSTMDDVNAELESDNDIKEADKILLETY